MKQVSGLSTHTVRRPTAGHARFLHHKRALQLVPPAATVEGFSFRWIFELDHPCALMYSSFIMAPTGTVVAVGSTSCWISEAHVEVDVWRTDDGMILYNYGSCCFQRFSPESIMHSPQSENVTWGAMEIAVLRVHIAVQQVCYS